jgi:hypothetical protein
MPRASRSSTYGQLLRSCCTCTRTRYRQSSATSELTELAGALHAGGQAADGAQRHAFPSPSAQSTTPATSRTSTSTRSSTSTITDNNSATLAINYVNALRCVAPGGSIRRVARPPHPAGGHHRRGGDRPCAIFSAYLESVARGASSW